MSHSQTEKARKMQYFTEEKQRAVDRLYMDIAFRLAQESHCSKVHVAAVAVKNGRIVATGVNGTPSGTVNCEDYWRSVHAADGMKLHFDEWLKTQEWRDLHTVWSAVHEIHAEQNLFSEAARNGLCLEGTDVYVTLEPCANCAKLLAVIRPRRVIYAKKYDKGSPESIELLRECGIVPELLEGRWPTS